MSVALNVNGTTFNYPQTGDQNWGDQATLWAQAVTSGMLQKAGGTFTLTAEVDFGATYGLKSAYFKSRTANPASAGAVRLAKTDTLSFRNNANSADLALAINASDQLQFDGATLVTTLGALTGSRLVVTTAGGDLTTNSVTATEAGYLSGVSSGIQAQLNAKEPTITTLGADRGGTGVANNVAATTTRVGNFALTMTLTGITGVTLPTSGTLATLAGTETLSGKTFSDAVTRAQIATPASPASGYNKGPYPKSDDEFYVLSSAGTERQIANTATSEPRLNFLLNSNFRYWQRGTSSTTIANGATAYRPDRWYGKNSLGTNGVLTISRTTGANDGSLYGCQLQITTAPTAAQANGCELYQTLDNFTSLMLYNKTASFSVLVKALNNVTQVGVQFFYKTSEAKVDTAIGSEQTVAVTTGAWATARINGQALGTSMTTSGVIGVRIRVTAVSSGNTYDLNNGFIVEQAMLNLGAYAATYQPAYRSAAEEITALERFYEKSYDIDTNPGTATTAGQISYTPSVGPTSVAPTLPFRVRKRVNATFTAYSPNSGASGKYYKSTGSDQTMSANFSGGEHSPGEVDGTSATADTYNFYHFTADAEI